MAVFSEITNYQSDNQRFKKSNGHFQWTSTGWSILSIYLIQLSILGFLQVAVHVDLFTFTASFMEIQEVTDCDTTYLWGTDKHTFIPLFANTCVSLFSEL